MDWSSYWTNHPLNHLSPEEIEVQIGEMMQRYYQCPRRYLAHHISMCFRALCLHPDHHPSHQQSCLWLHSALYWQCLGDQESDIS